MINEIREKFFQSRLEMLRQHSCQYLNNFDVESYQVQKFNQVWADASNRIHFFKEWKHVYNLPDKIHSIKDLGLFPVLKKEDLVKINLTESSSGRKTFQVSTGGSTGKPLSIRKYTSEADDEYVNAYLGRNWCGIHPFDKIALVWGHSHLFGQGLSATVKFYQRKLFDRLINTIRLSAYHLDDDSLLKNYMIISKFKPSVIIGYTSAITSFAKFIIRNRLKFDNRFDCIVLTSETITEHDVTLVESAFDCSVVIEYGMVETGVVAYSRCGDTNINVLWHNFICNVNDGELLLTTLNNRFIPLINYQTNDLVDVNTSFNDSVTSFKRIIGRKNDNLHVRFRDCSSLMIHAELFTHVIKGIPDIDDFRITQKASEDTILIQFTTKSMVEAKFKSIVLSNLSKELKHLDDRFIQFIRVESLPRTLAGKSKFIMIEE